MNPSNTSIREEVAQIIGKFGLDVGFWAMQKAGKPDDPTDEILRAIETRLLAVAPLKYSYMDTHGHKDPLNAAIEGFNDGVAQYQQNIRRELK